MDEFGETTGAEALIRWHHPDQGLVTPFHFIPLAEEKELILPIGQWVLDSGCKQLSLWQQSNQTAHLTLSINVSAKQFRQTDFTNTVLAAVTKHGIDPRKLKLELTESVFLDDISSTIKTMKSLAESGVQFSLDDFGTGYSSLQYMKQLPIYQLKIDQSFVRDLLHDSSDQAIVRTIIAMAESLGLSVIAEGVENEAQRETLLAYGCKQFQGYLFSQPIKIDDLNALLATKRKN